MFHSLCPERSIKKVKRWTSVPMNVRWQTFVGSDSLSSERTCDIVDKRNETEFNSKNGLKSDNRKNKSQVDFVKFSKQK
jgi:hypothetical protein